MRRIATFLLAVTTTAMLVLAGPVGPAHAEDTGGVRIMPLGDSITDGYNVPGGYRINLWQELTAEGHLPDFVGSQDDGPADLPDHDHEGHPGWRIDQIDANVASWVGAAAPRTVLLHIGTNDIVQNYDLPDAPARLSGLIDDIAAAAPGADVFVASIVPFADPVLNSEADAYNATIPGIVAGKGPRVHFVDMHAQVSAANLADGVHPTRTGYDQMAAGWDAALESVPGSAGDDGAPVTLPTWNYTSLRVTTPGYTDRYVRHQNFLGYTEHVDAGSDDLLKQDATWQIVPGLAGTCYSLQSRDYPGWYLRHQNYRVKLSADDGTELMHDDATWCPRSAPGGVRLSPIAFPGSYLRHINGELWLATPGGSNAWDNITSMAPDVTWSFDAPWSP